MIWTVTRYDFTDVRTMGKLDIQGVFQCYILEDRVREDPNPDTPANEAKVYGTTAIPYGRYRCLPTISGRAKAGTLWTPWSDGTLPQLMSVPGFEGIRVHAANTARQVEGCLAVGLRRDGDQVIQSRDALTMLKPKFDAAWREGELWVELAQ